MKLEEYLEGMLEIRGRKTPRPDTLEMPRNLLQHFTWLFHMTEQNGVEHGGPLFYDDERQSVFAGDIAKGTASSMSIPKSDFDNNIGNVHAHPTESIGHRNGFCAHSMQDMLTFENELGKPFFIQFVVSGSRVYAVIYTRDVSRFDAEMKRLTNQLKDSVLERAKAYMVEAYGEERYLDKITSFENYEDAEAFLQELKLSTPGLGPLMQKLSIEACMRIVRDFKYSFYAGDMKSAFKSSTLVLQK